MIRDYPHGRKSVKLDREYYVHDSEFASAEWHERNRAACEKLLALLHKHHGKQSHPQVA